MNKETQKTIATVITTAIISGGAGYGIAKIWGEKPEIPTPTPTPVTAEMTPEKNQVQSEIKAKEEDEKIEQINFNEGQSSYDLSVKAGTINKIWSEKGLTVRGTQFKTNEDTILWIIGDNCEDAVVGLENLPKSGTKLVAFKDQDVKNYKDFYNKYFNELIPDKTGIQNSIVIAIENQAKVRFSNIGKKEVKKEEPKVVERIIERTIIVRETPKPEPKKPEVKKPEVKKPEVAKQPEKKPERISIQVNPNVEWEAQPGWIVSGDIEYFDSATNTWQRVYDTWQDYPEGKDKSARTADIVVIQNRVKIRGEWGFTRSFNIPLAEIKANKENEKDKNGSKIFDEVRVKYL
ncbi:MAG TPA: hypothetical protein PK131_00975 [Candidatus Woesebacteria bacterium]|nr:hypothetical protein [Candidatus Woesebacteria bacterium]HRT40334.1 hypothetical protein [Candidatus Woesebacteria bacterium]